MFISFSSWLCFHLHPNGWQKLSKKIFKKERHLTISQTHNVWYIDLPFTPQNHPCFASKYTLHWVFWYIMDSFLSCHVVIYMFCWVLPTDTFNAPTSAAVTETNPTGEGYFTSVTVRRTCLPRMGRRDVMGHTEGFSTPAVLLVYTWRIFFPMTWIRG